MTQQKQNGNIIAIITMIFLFGILHSLQISPLQWGLY